ncbi:MAG: zinc-dependent metalloprotease, partial [Armatimonadota bacterium]
LEKRDVVDPSSILERIAPSVPAPLESRHNFVRCTFATGRREAAWFGLEASKADPRGGLISEKEYVAQFLKETVAHEMGHILGLRHNFAGSAQRTASQLRDPNLARTLGITASLMDYTPFNPFAVGRRDVPWFSPVAGEYDRWAIQYGYTSFAGVADPDAERPFLARIARRSGEPGLAYQTDEAADGIDPGITRYDLGSDPLGYWEQTLATSRKLISTLDRRSPAVGETYWDFTRRLMQLLNTTALAGGQVSRYIGGVALGRSHRGDPFAGPVSRPVAGTEQRRALGILDRTLWAPGALSLPARYAGLLTVDPEVFPSAPGEFPVQDWLANIGRSALRRILSGPVLSRVANNAAKFPRGERPFDLPELFASLDSLLWRELASGVSVEPRRRQLQRQHVDLVVEMVIRGGVPEDARMLAWESVERLRGRLRRARSRDRLTRIHWADLAARVGRALDARSASGGMTAQQLLQALSGAKETDVRR